MGFRGRFAGQQPQPLMSALAHSGHMQCTNARPLCPNSDRESGFPRKVMSALPPKANMCSALRHVCFGPIADTCGATNDVRYGPNADVVRRVILVPYSASLPEFTVDTLHRFRARSSVFDNESP
jgi:hypothetical protein